MDYSEQIKIAYEATERGDNSLAREVLEEVLSSDADIEPAWYLYAHIATNREDAVHSLKQVLELNPAHARARQELDRLQGAAAPHADGTEAGTLPLQEGAVTKPAAAALNMTSSPTETMLLWGLAGLACLILISAVLFIYVKFAF